MGKLTDAVKRWSLEDTTLESPDLTVRPDRNRSTLRFFKTSAASGVYRAFFEVTEDAGLVEFYLYAPEHVPDAKRAPVAEAITRAQHLCKVPGKLEMSMGDGEIRFRGAIDTEGRRITGKMLSRLFVDACAVLDRYIPAFFAVVTRDVSPEDAIAEAFREAPEAFDASEAPAWEELPGTDRVKAWSHELRAACNALENTDVVWEMTGRAIVMIGEEMRSCQKAAWRAAVDAGMNFVSFEKDDVLGMPSPSAFKRKAPVMVFMRPGRWLLLDEDGESAESAERMKEFQARLASWIRDFDPVQPVVYVTSAFRITDVVESLRHVGLFDRFLNVPAPTMEKWGQGIIDRIGSENCAPSMTSAPAKVGQLFRMTYDDDRRESLALLRIRRLLATVNRPMEFLDLVNLDTRGFVEEDAPPAGADAIRRQTAYHEAGHAAVAVIDSHGKNVPDYASIVPSAFFKGVVVDAYDYHSSQGDQLTYEAFRHKVRLWLAGRAAEEMYLGALQISNGSRGDLDKATDFACDGFGLWGFAPSMDEAGKSGSNLTVAVDKPTAFDVERVHGLVREFLATEYAVVMKMLVEHRAFVDAIAERLLWDPILDQKTLTQMADKHRATGVVAAGAAVDGSSASPEILATPRRRGKAST
jgi:hypothetical protein